MRLGLYANIFLLNIKYRKYLRNLATDPKNLVEKHFQTWSDEDHINIKGFQNAIDNLNWNAATIIETGTSAWGTDSTRLWDSYIRMFGGTFHSVDIRKDASLSLYGQMHSRTQLVVGDSVEFLKTWTGKKAQLVYLDSWDLDLNNPNESAAHGKRELENILDFLESGSLVLIDDTPNDSWFEAKKDIPIASMEFKNFYGKYPGKGAFFHQVLEPKFSYEVLHHEYSILLRIL